MGIHRVTIILVLFVLLGLVIGTYASRALFDTDGISTSAARGYGSGINGARQYGRSARSTTESVVGKGGSTRGVNGGTGGEDGGGSGSRDSNESAAKDEYGTNHRGGAIQ
ncbi:hypothetical protein CsatB_004542 [Cannabis sativa]